MNTIVRRICAVAVMLVGLILLGIAIKCASVPGDDLHYWVPSFSSICGVLTFFVLGLTAIFVGYLAWEG